MNTAPRRIFIPPWIALAVFACSVVTSSALAQAAAAARSSWVFPGADGKLVYRATPAGDRIMDFSYAGYGGGGVALPDVPGRETVKPTGGDDTAAIQAAIDRVAALPLENGFRGAVLLAPGTFMCASPITISASGVVLRGAGSGASAGAISTLKLTGKPHLTIGVRAPGGGRRQRSESEGGGSSDTAAPLASTTIADAYVPSGARSFTVADTKAFAIGDTIEIRRPVTAAWVKLMAMDDLTRDGRPQTWLRAGTTTVTERRIAAIAGNRITLDVPLSDSFDAKYLNPPGTAVVKIAPPPRVKNVGIESLHIECPPQEISHTAAHFTALRINGEDCWARDLAIDETMNSVGLGGRRITLERVTVRRKAKHQGASKPAEFAPNASEVLLDRCAVIAENVWFIATGAGVAGPIVILNGTFIGNGRSEAHQRWSTGMLYDNCRAPEGGFELRNRGSMGSGHGWAMGWGVLWNCTAKEFLVQNPPGAMNWIIGSIGHSGGAPRPFGAGTPLPGGTEDAMGANVTPQSLYLTQLAERLGPQALKAIGYASTDPRSAAGIVSVNDAGAHTSATPNDSANAASLGENLAIDRPVLTTNVRGNERQFAGWQALDRDDATFWATDDGVASARLELDTEGACEINAIALGEAEGKTGQVRGYRVEGFVDSAWKTLAEGTSIGAWKVQRFTPVVVWKVRLTILDAKPSAAIRTFGIFHEPKL